MKLRIKNTEKKKSRRYVEPKHVVVAFLVLLVVGTGVAASMSSNLTQNAEKKASPDVVDDNNVVWLQVYGTNIFGMKMAWVTDQWTFAYDTGNLVFVIGPNTFNTLNNGGVWPDGGSFNGAYTCPSATVLFSSVNWKLSSPFNSNSGSMYVKVTPNSYDNVNFYYGIDGSTTSVTIPISVTFGDDADVGT